MLFLTAVTSHLQAVLFAAAASAQPAGAADGAPGVEEFAGPEAPGLAAAMDAKLVCKYDQPALSINSFWVDQQLKKYVLPDLRYIQTETDYNNRWVVATDMWTIEGGVNVNFSWALQQRQDFPGGWYGPTGDGWAKIDIWVDDSKLYMKTRKIQLSNNVIYNWVSDMLGVDDIAYDELNNVLWETFGYGTPVGELLGGEAAEIIATYGVDPGWSSQVVAALAESYLWMRIGEKRTYFGLSNWDAVESGVLGGTVGAAEKFAVAIVSMCKKQ